MLTWISHNACKRTEKEVSFFEAITLDFDIFGHLVRQRVRDGETAPVFEHHG